MPEVGFFELYPAARPSLPAGTYIMAADHDLTATPPHGADGALAIDGTDFTVKIQSPRYTMPPGQVLSTFPPNAAVGDWRQRLPQIVFKRRTLPWERDPDTAEPRFGFAPEQRPPYLALVVLAEGEGVLSGEVPIAECVTAGTPMLDDADTARGRYLEVRRSIIDAVFPTVADLGLLAHVRKVNLEDTELALGDDDGYLAVVVANRLPMPGVRPAPDEPIPPKRYTAYLLNLEGQLRALPTQTETVPDFTVHRPDLLLKAVTGVIPPPLPLDVITMKPRSMSEFVAKGPAAGIVSHAVEHIAAVGVEQQAAGYAIGHHAALIESADDNVAARKWVEGGIVSESIVPGLIDYIDPPLRFPVLTSWDFVCTGEGTFESIMMDLRSGMLATQDDELDPALRPDITETGHIGLDHRTRRGEPARAWYRGPFVPQPTVRIQPEADGSLPLPHTGDQLRRVVPDGHEDLSRAAAFEIGRLLALSKPGVVAGLARWRRELFGAARLAQYASTYVDDLIAGFADAALGPPRLLDDLIAGQIVGHYATAIRTVLPAAAEFPQARVPDELLELRPESVLAGLGLDSRAVRKRVRTDGVGVFAEFEPVVAEAVTKPLSSMPDDVGIVQAALLEHVERVAAQSVARSVDKATRRRRDALDRLIASAADATDPTTNAGSNARKEARP